jgi:cytidylate kinase
VIIAIDGPAAAGKGTLARRLAMELGLPHLDTGLLYRAVGRRVLDRGADPADPAVAQAEAEALRIEDLGRSDLRGPAADQASSLVAAIPGVRAALLAFQRGFATRGGAVLDGRDIGTVIFPDADVKLFVTASLEARAMRRWREQQAASLEAVTAELQARDAKDAARAAAPLKPADDATILDTTRLGVDEAFAAALRVVQAAIRP